MRIPGGSRRCRRKSLSSSGSPNDYSIAIVEVGVQIEAVQIDSSMGYEDLSRSACVEKGCFGALDFCKNA
jgi:hypothetical protein